MSEDSLKIISKPPMGGLKKGIAANRQQFENSLRSTDPNTVPNRLGLVMDDSGSMGQDGMENAHKAIKGFTESCNYKDTSITIYPLNADEKPLTCDYDMLNMYVGRIWATGGTPIYSRLNILIEKENITRAVIFSDGQPTDSSVLHEDSNSDFYYGTRDKQPFAKEVVEQYKSKVPPVPIDTVYIGEGENKELQMLAELTGGTYIHFKDSLSLSTGLRYLAPKFRALLANPDVKERIERGEKI